MRSIKSIVVQAAIIGLGGLFLWLTPAHYTRNILLGAFALIILAAPIFQVTLLTLLKLTRPAACVAGFYARSGLTYKSKPTMILWAANLFYQLDDRKNAEKYARMGVKLMEDKLDQVEIQAQYAGCLNVLGLLRLDAGRYKEALEYLYLPIEREMEPNLMARSYVSCAAALFSLGEFQRGLDDARHAMSLCDAKRNDIMVVGHFNAAMCLIEMERYAEALTESTAAIAFSPISNSRSIISACHALALYLNGNEAESEVWVTETNSFSTGQKLSQYLSNVYGILGRIRYLQNRLQESLAYYQKYIDSEPIPSNYYYLYLIAQKQGDAAAALVWRDKLTTEFPESFWARNAQVV